MKIRDEEKIAQRKQLMLIEAKKIILKEGIEALSIRKLAEAIHQTPGIIYHYFKNKDELLLEIVKEGYQEIVKQIIKNEQVECSADEQLRNTLKDYMRGMLQQPELYQIMMQSRHPMVLAQTQILKPGIAKERSSIGKLCTCIERGVHEQVFTCEHIELRAQSIWCSVYGCINRCIEEQIEEEQKENLMDEIIEMILSSLRKNK